MCKSRGANWLLGVGGRPPSLLQCGTIISTTSALSSPSFSLMACRILIGALRFCKAASKEPDIDMCLQFCLFSCQSTILGPMVPQMWL